MIDGQKMSKSLGNVISPQQLIDLFGVDGARYLITRSFPNENDSDIGIERFKEKYNADLANNLGNLVSRVAKLSEGLQVAQNESIFLDSQVVEKIDKLKLDEALGDIFERYIDKTNNYLNQESPWKLAKDDEKRKEILTRSILNLRAAAVNLSPILPQTSERILEIFKGKIKPLDNSLFPRI